MFEVEDCSEYCHEMMEHESQRQRNSVEIDRSIQNQVSVMN